jgi:hypothetical protein
VPGLRRQLEGESLVEPGGDVEAVENEDGPERGDDQREDEVDRRTPRDCG